MIKEQLLEILDNHQLWLSKDLKGIRADLEGANLRRADLEGANLRRANLTEAKLPYFQIISEEGDFIGWKKNS